jgi:hypothetical protein
MRCWGGLLGLKSYAPCLHFTCATISYTPERKICTFHSAQNIYIYIYPCALVAYFVYLVIAWQDDAEEQRARRRRMLSETQGAKIRRGLIRYLQLVVDFSRSRRGFRGDDFSCVFVRVWGGRLDYLVRVRTKQWLDEPVFGP